MNKATLKSPGIRGWMWATGRKITKAMRLLGSDGKTYSVMSVDYRDKAMGPWKSLFGGCYGYIMRRPKPKKKRSRK